MACRTADVTVRGVLPEFPNTVAVMVVEPAATEVASPKVSIVCGIRKFDELHVTCVVRSWTVLSVKIPVAVNC